MTDARPKRLNEMDDLRDMGRFPVPVYVGATSNILLTICLTYLLRGRYESPLMLPAWAVGIISANLMPVIVLRSRMDDGTSFPEIEEMDFFGDQHKFSSWVYAVASGNMLFWILLAWSVFSRRRDRKTLVGVLVLAFVCTFFPAWVRLFRGR
ncbi:hypothetical protein GBA63_14960 [Rubrobacter tropicus]|uniref:Uncharacterized protein n=1 Tax=Rubrobacter tropicus TaxID=2653851 RepID=A0A6G8QBC7_9ACTN|nr:hypothetical protein [Rubrobacter tropicus]QIN83790.1 hypothetical protein GBA63_14960 [Rubrobacter tropicus]